MYGGPIDDENGPEGKLNGWPMDEAYVDYVVGNQDAGIINQIQLFPKIDTKLIEELNEKDGETNLSTGYHAIEFLLWGQDLNQNPNEAGKRPYTDYVLGVGKNADRRGQYLLAAADLLIQDLDYVIKAWNPNENNFRKNFTSTPLVSLRKIIQALKEFSEGEMAGERMQVAYDTQNQEDEHSCFSDNTHNDHLYDVVGVINVYEGKYTRLDGSVIQGTSISDLVKSKNPDLDKEIKTHLAFCKSSIEALEKPFDQAILKAQSREKIQIAIKNLTEIGQKFIKVYDTVNQ